MSLFRFVQPDSSITPHSNGLANAADRGKPSLGSVSPESFAQRKHVDRNRQHVSRFREAMIHHDYRRHHIQARVAQPEPQKSQDAAPAANAPRPVRPISSIPRTTGGYREPSSRGFNPFR